MEDITIKIGDYNTLQVDRIVDFGVYLDNGKNGILLPARWVPENTQKGDTITAFIYHDNEDRLIATTMTPKAVVGDIALLKVASITDFGAFLEWGVMKDVFIAKSQQVSDMEVGNSYLVKLYIDERSTRVAATERLDPFLSNHPLTVALGDEVDMIVYRKTEIGYTVIVNKLHKGMLYLNEIYQKINIGDTLKGFVKKVYDDGKLDVSIGKQGYQRVENETEKVLRLLTENNGVLPFNDKSEPTAIYDFFGMSKKTFKMTTGNLYKQKKIAFTEKGIELV